MSGPHASALANSLPNADVIPGEYIVVYKPGVADASAHTRRLAGRERAEVKRSFSRVLPGFAVRASADEAARIARDPAVAYVEQNRVLRAASVQTSAPWGLDRIDQRKSRLDDRYGYKATGAGVTIYVIDSGIEYGNAEFGGRAVPLGDFVVRTGRPEDRDTGGADCFDHGTAVAAVAGGATFGVAKGATLKSVRVLNCFGEGTLESILAGVEAVATDHQPGSPAVVNMSVTAPFLLQSLVDAVEAIVADGVTFVVAAGNGIPQPPDGQTSLPDDACGWVPAAAPSAIAVGATDLADHEASFSNFGTCLDVLAPGVAVATSGMSGIVRPRNGTSYAAPMVAGAVARYLQTNPTARPAQVAKFLANTATGGAITLNDPSNRTPNRLLFIGASQ